MQRDVLQNYLYPVYREIGRIAKEQGAFVALAVLDVKIKPELITRVLADIYEREGAVFYTWQKGEFAKMQKDRDKPDDSSGAGFFSQLWRQIMRGVMSSADLLIRITNIDRTTKNDLRKILKTAADNNLGARETARLFVRENDHLKRRALTIARTETTYAASMGTEQAANESTLPLKKVWIAAKDERTRADHNAANGQRVDKNAKFVVGDKLMKYPGDPSGGAKQVINCRCAVSYIVDEQRLN